jgi:hypothetical protein
MNSSEKQPHFKDPTTHVDIDEKNREIKVESFDQQKGDLSQKQENTLEEQSTVAPLPRSTIFMIMWTVIFGTSLALGGSLLEPFPIPWLSITLASPLVAFLITLNKIVLNRRLSVTAMYVIAGSIAVFTTYLGPPSIFKPLYILAGFSFDAATLFRTKNLKFWNLIFGHLAITITGFFIFWIIFLVMLPDAAKLVGQALLIAAPVHFIVSILVAYIVYKIIPPDNPPDFVVKIRSQLED